MKRIVVLGMPLLSLALIVSAVRYPVSRAQSGSSYVEIAGGHTDAFGYLNIIEVSTIDPGATGHTYARLSSGGCDVLPDEAIVLEGQMKLESNGTYSALLYPVGAPAKQYPALNKGVIQINPFNNSPIKPGYPVIAGLFDGPPGTWFSVCLRPPGTYCVPWDGGSICQAQYPIVPVAPGPTTVSAGGPYTGFVNAPVTFTASAEHVPAGLGHVFTWDFGDGTTTTGGVVTHTYANPGAYQVSVSVAYAFTGIAPLAQHSTTATISLYPVINLVPVLGATLSFWTPAGAATSDEGGAWRFNANAGLDLIGAGLTWMRVTSGTCDTPVDAAIVFEGELHATEAGDGSWDGELAPSGGPARSLPNLDLASGDVHLIPTPRGTQIDAALDGLPPQTTFAVCLRVP